MDPSSLQVPFLHDDTIRQHADELRTMYWNGKMPVDVDLIMEKIGIVSRPMPNMRFLAGLEACISNDAQSIFFDWNAPENRLRFSIAHELGHYKMHRNELNYMKPSSVEDWKEIIDEIPNHVIRRLEYQANEFAGRLLVPIEHLLKSFQIVKEDLFLMKDFIGNNYYESFAFIAAPLGKEFGVSDDVMLKRLKKEDVNPYDFLK